MFVARRNKNFSAYYRIVVFCFFDMDFAKRIEPLGKRTRKMLRHMLHYDDSRRIDGKHL